MLVNNLQELANAIDANETDIVLASNGTFSVDWDPTNRNQIVSIQGKRNITIRSQDPGRPQTLVGFDVYNSDNIQIEQVKLTGLDRDYSAGAKLRNSNNITFSEVAFEGQPNFASLAVSGLMTYDSARVTVQNSTFKNLRRGINASNAKDFRILNNEFVNQFEDGISVGNPQGLLIANNVLRDFSKAASNALNDPHPDAIQLLSFKPGSRDVMIKNNVALMGDGATFQGIHIKPLAQENAINRLTIENNLIHTNMARGVSLYHARNVSIADNTIVFRDRQRTSAGTRNTGILLENVQSPIVRNNIAGLFKINDQVMGKNGVPFSNGNVATNAQSLTRQGDLAYQDIFANGASLTRPDFYSTLSKDDFVLVAGQSPVGANLDKLPSAIAGAPLAFPPSSSVSISPSPLGRPRPFDGLQPTAPNLDNVILISSAFANQNGDVFGTAEDDVMVADANSTGLRARGGHGDDVIFGSDDVRLVGENGDDTLILNGGNSLVRGGQGQDKFVLTSQTKTGSLVIDFVQGEDQFVFQQVEGVRGISDLSISPQNRSYTKNSIISFNDQQIRVKNMMAENFTIADFVFE